jgi:hypothetical protein
MWNTNNYRVKKVKLEYNDDGTPVRQYLNDDPGTPGPDRPTYADLSIYDKYEGYRDLVWIPLDLPALDIDLDHVYGLSNDKAIQDKVYDAKNVGKLLFLKQNHCGGAGVNAKWHDYAVQEFQDVVNYIETLPFESIHQIFFVQTPKEIPAHYDEEKALVPLLRKQAPSHLHFRWSKVTDWRNEHFYMTKDSGATRVFPMLPPSTNSFAYDGGTYEHGVEKGFQMNERLQLVIHGVYDLPKWHGLLEKSFQTYKEYTITTEHLSL